MVFVKVVFNLSISICSSKYIHHVHVCINAFLAKNVPYRVAQFVKTLELSILLTALSAIIKVSSRFLLGCCQ